MRERTIEQYLDRQVAAAGGTTRKWVSPGHKHVPDRIVFWGSHSRAFDLTNNRNHFVETKAPGGEATPGQLREHNRLRGYGCTVKVLDTKEKIDRYVERMR